MPDQPITLESHSPLWQQKFKAEEQLIRKTIPGFIYGRIEHVGSTAIPTILAKPTVDIMVGIESLEQARPAIQTLATISYCYWPYKKTVMHWFCKPSAEEREFHLHLIPFQSRLWQERIFFRNYLNEYPEVAHAYEQLKKHLWKRYPYDREQYSSGKTDFVTKVLANMDCSKVDHRPQ